MDRKKNSCWTVPTCIFNVTTNKYIYIVIIYTIQTTNYKFIYAKQNITLTKPPKKHTYASHDQLIFSSKQHHVSRSQLIAWRSGWSRPESSWNMGKTETTNGWSDWCWWDFCLIFSNLLFVSFCCMTLEVVCLCTKIQQLIQDPTERITEIAHNT